MKINKKKQKEKKYKEKYFYINKKGNINICINYKKKKYLELKKIINKKKLPLKISFPQIIKDRIKLINNSFKKNIKLNNLNTKYYLIYPIKVNQEAYIIKYILKNTKYKIGLESGSKAELMTILVHAHKNIKILCNGYKDKKYIFLAKIAAKIGHKVFLVIEKIQEIFLIIKYIKKSNLNIGIRIKLNSLEFDNKKNKSQFKFGLNTSQIISCIKIFKRNKLINKLNLLHCHIGSQINNIKYLENNFIEFIKIYIDLYKIFKIRIKYLDFGGGLAVNYYNKKSYINYDLDLYTFKISKIIFSLCKKYKVPTPKIFTESGRFITAHHTILVTNIANVENNKIQNISNKLINNNYISKQKIIKYLNLWNKIKTNIYINEKKIFKKLKKIKKYHQSIKLNIIEKSLIEKIYSNILIYIKKNKIIKNKKKNKNINLYISNKIHINFSIFQSLPDSWGIKQIFPISPIKGLNNKKTQQIHILDITCDSDGKINKYINKNIINNTLTIPKYKNKHLPEIIFFMVGAYQNILSNIHNLFGKIETLLVYIKKKKKSKSFFINKYDNILKMLKHTQINKNKINIFLKKNINKKIYNKLNKFLKYKTYLE